MHRNGYLRASGKNSDIIFDSLTLITS